MADEGKVAAAARELAAASGFHLLDVEHVRGRNRTVVRITLDRPGGITLDDCQNFSRRLEERLDAQDLVPGPYTLEVASPGLDRVLKNEGEFEYFKGRDVEVTAREPVDGRRRWLGKLGGLVDDKVVVTGPEGETFAIPCHQVQRVRLHPDLSPPGRRKAGRKHGGREN
ncbi:MAG TPA: ribosome maturation factor RimP [Sphingobacteriaceae bacterium]|nr:ribosome maturation factor RimP [Sphingobacteriaceae bacterium]